MKRFVLAAAVLVGCAPTTYTFTAASARGVVSKDENCKIEILTSPPTGNYEETGTLEYYNGKEPTNVDDFKKAVHTQACKAGGDAVIAIANEKGQYTKGSVIHYLGDMATGVKPITDMPTTQQPDTDTPPSR